MSWQIAKFFRPTKANFFLKRFQIRLEQFLKHWWPHNFDQKSMKMIWRILWKCNFVTKCWLCHEHFQIRQLQELCNVHGSNRLIRPIRHHEPGKVNKKLTIVNTQLTICWQIAKKQQNWTESKRLNWKWAKSKIREKWKLINE